MNLFGLNISFKKSAVRPETLPPLQIVKNKDAAYYEGGGGLGTNYKSGGAKYRGGLTNSPAMIYNHYELRKRGRMAYQDSVHAHGLVTRWADSIADTGLKLDSNPNYKILGIEQSAGEIWAANVESRFNLWAKNKDQNRSEVQNFYQSHRFYQRNKKRDGENFIRLYYSRDRNLINPLQFEFIDPNQIRGDAVTSTMGHYAQNDGIERDGRGREKSYKIWNSKIVNGVPSYDFETISRVGSRSKRVMVIHSFEPEYPGQQRGFSEMAHFIQEFEKLTDFTAAQIQKAINQSNIVGAIENNIQDPSNPFQDLPLTPPNSSGYGVAAEGIDPTGDAVPADGSDRYDVSVCQPNEINLDKPGSTMILNTKLGDKIRFHESTAPADGFAVFVDSFLSNLSSSSGMPLSVLKMKMEGSYSAARGELLLFWRSVVIGRENMSADYLSIIFEMWLSEEIAAGRITAPGWMDPILRAAWMNSTWIGAPMPNIDPLRTAKGVKEYLSMSATTGERVALENNGSDFKANVIKNTTGFKLMPVPFWEQQAPIEIQGENKNGKSGNSSTSR